jgi:FkbM family methyltransferase
MNTLKSNLFQQNTDLEVIELLIPYLTKHSFLDIGAAKGEFTLFFAKNGLKGVFFEPLPDCAEELLELSRQTDCVFSNYAIDDHDHTASFYHAFDKSDNDTQHFSSLHPLQNDHRISHKNVGEVQCRSLNSLLDEGMISQSIGVIKIDTEGNDLNVLKAMDKVTTEILMCEYFMPEIYAGWELGHPNGLIEQAKKLGFNQCISIRRIANTELVSLNNLSFIDKEWGNLVFISDKIYTQMEVILQNYLKAKETAFMGSVLMNFQEMQSICDERQNIIDELKQSNDERLHLINQLSQEIERLQNKKRSWIKKLPLKSQ